MTKNSEIYWLLFNYSEFLDSQHLIVGDSGPDADKRSHDELVREFLAKAKAKA